MKNLEKIPNGWNYSPDEDPGYCFVIMDYSPSKNKANVSFYYQDCLIHNDIINLSWDRGRKQFATACSAGDNHLICQFLMKISLLLKAINEPSSQVEKALDPEEYLDKDLTDLEQNNIIDFLKNPTLVDEIIHDFEILGHVGENNNKLISYIVGTSRISNNPLGLIIQGSSGAGKSFLIERLMEVMPKESVWFKSRLTPQSLYHLSPNELCHKLVVIAEREGIECDYSLRSLISERRLFLAAPEKDEKSGSHHTISKEVYGPVAYIETTTRPNLNQENTSRCFMIHPDCTQGQTERIQNRIRDKYKGESIPEREKELIRRKHRNAQRLLEPANVIIPYIDLIHFPTEGVKYRRIYERFMILIEIITLLHQQQRPRYDDERLFEATIDDYRLAYNLILDILKTELIDLDYRDRELLTHCKELSQLNIYTLPQPFTINDICRVTSWPRTTAARSLAHLVEYGLILQEGGGQGRTAHYQYQMKPNNLSLNITTPEELQKNQMSENFRKWRDSKESM